MGFPDLVFLTRVPSSLLGMSLSECTPGHLQHCRTAVLLKTWSCPPLSLARVCPYPEEHRAVCPLPHQQQLVFTGAKHIFVPAVWKLFLEAFCGYEKKTEQQKRICPSDFPCDHDISMFSSSMDHWQLKDHHSLLFDHLTLKWGLFLQGLVQWKAEKI